MSEDIIEKCDPYGRVYVIRGPDTKKRFLVLGGCKGDTTTIKGTQDESKLISDLNKLIGTMIEWDNSQGE